MEYEVSVGGLVYVFFHEDDARAAQVILKECEREVRTSQYDLKIDNVFSDALEYQNIDFSYSIEGLFNEN